MFGLIGKKIGMTAVFDENGKRVACTLVQAGPCIITQVKTKETDGYNAAQIGFGEQKESRISKALKGHFDKAKVKPVRKMVEVRDFQDAKVGAEINVEGFEEGEFVDVVGTSKGKGFQGVVKRHGFRGVGGQTHGQHNRGRAPGSIGAASYPARVFKAMKMAGQMGNESVKVDNLKVVKIDKENHYLLLGGSIPGHKGAYIMITK